MRRGEGDVRDAPGGRGGVRLLVLERLPVALLGGDGRRARGQLDLLEWPDFCCHLGQLGEGKSSRWRVGWVECRSGGGSSKSRR